MDYIIKNPKTGEELPCGKNTYDYYMKRGWVSVKAPNVAEAVETEKKPVEVVENPSLENDEPTAEPTAEAPVIEEQAPEKRTRKTRVSVPNE
jgi:hypothetical protein